MSRTLRLTRREGAITELRLREDNMWVLDANPVKKRKGDNGEALRVMQKAAGEIQ
ncbi:hypothetical protein D3C77_696160 [compost metagenome]